MSRYIGPNNPLRVAIADDSGLTFSDNYRAAWIKGFRGIGCDVQVFDIGIIRRAGIRHSAYSSGSSKGYVKQVAQNIVAWRPDLVWCHHGRSASHPQFLEKLHASRLRTAVYLCDEPYETGETARYSTGFRFVFTMDPCTIKTHLDSRSPRTGVFYLPPGADTEEFAYRDYSKRVTPCFFLGNADLVPRPSFLKPVENAIDGVDIRFWGGAIKSDARWVTPMMHAGLYSGCKVGLNVHRAPWLTEDQYKKRVVGRSPHMRWPAGLKPPTGRPPQWGTGFWNDGNLPSAHVNPRFFEMAACGTLVVNDDHRPELERMFPMAPRAHTPERFFELVRYYLDHTDEAERIGLACSQLISKRHSYLHRAAEVLIRVGLRASPSVDLPSSLGAPEDWLTPQDFNEQGVRLCLAATGPSEPWSPQSGMLLTRMSGSPKDATSIDVPTPWSS